MRYTQLSITNLSSDLVLPYRFIAFLRKKNQIISYFKEFTVRDSMFQERPSINKNKS